MAAVRKEDGQEYPGKIIYEMTCSSQCYLRFQRKGPLFIIDKKGREFGLKFCVKREGAGGNWQY